MPSMINDLARRFSKYSEVIVAFLTVAIIGIIMIPLSTFFLDVLLVTNLGMAVVIFVLTLFATTVLQFSTFPTMLLVTTMFRLALNISATRLILSTGYAGRVIDAFANFVTGDNYIVGAVIYLIIVLVQIIVVTNGASRVSEVSARFTLDAMPGKQMAIDADLNSGLIDEETAKIRRKNLQRESNFYGAMDGASKFVKGDAIAGIIITVVNLVGGILIFSLQGMGVMDAIDQFGKLTIGAGIVSQVGSLLISLASGILVTRSDDGQGFGKSVTQELFGIKQVLMVASAVLLMIALVPAFPTIPFLIISIALGSVAYLLKENEKAEIRMQEERAAAVTLSKRKKQEPEGIMSFQVEPVSMEIGYGLISIVDEGREDNLISQITSIRRQCALEMGIVVNPIRIRDNLELAPNEYVIKIKGNTASGGHIYLDKYMALDPGNMDFELDGIRAKDPAFGIDALWINSDVKDAAEMHGYTVVEPVTVLVTHLKEIIKENSPELLGRQEVKQLLEGIKGDYNVVVDELVPDILTLGEVQKVLQGLLREGVPIFDLVTILESLADNGRMTKDTETLIEYVRNALKRTIVKRYLNPQGKLEVVTIHPELEELIGNNVQRTMGGSMPVLKPNAINQIFDSLSKTSNEAMLNGAQPVILASPRIRVALRNLIAFNFPNIGVLSINEIPNDVEIEAIGLVDNI